MSADTRPDLTVVIASVNGLPYPLACLDALAHQEGDYDIEVIVADSTAPSTVAAIRELHPQVRVIEHDVRKSVPFLRAAGIGAATGRLVAVTEDHCVPRRDWAKRIIEGQLRTGWAAIGGGVENGARSRVVDWAVFFCEYNHLMNPVPAGPTMGLPGMNVAYDMDALAPVRDIFTEGLWENFLHERIHAEGFEMGLDPGIVVSHEKHFTIPMFLDERFHYSRAFAGYRVEGAGLLRRLAWAGATLLLPGLLVARITRNVVRKGGYLGWYTRSLPLIVVFSVMWAIGEMVGYLTGPGDSLTRIK